MQTTLTPLNHSIEEIEEEVAKLWRESLSKEHKKVDNDRWLPLPLKVTSDESAHKEEEA